jgi:tetratricopeptide (TPR) repeat protein
MDSQALVAAKPGNTNSARTPWFVCGVVTFLVLSSVAWKWVFMPVPLDRLRLYCDTQAWEQAISGLETQLRASPGHVEASFLLARAYSAQERFADAAQVLSHVNGTPFEKVQALLRAGQAAHMGGLRRSAERHWLAALALESDDPAIGNTLRDCRRELCDLYAIQRRGDDLFRTSLDMEKRSLPVDRAVPLLIRLRFWTTVIEPASAIPTLKKSIEADPDDIYSRCALGRYQIDAEQMAEAHATLAQCVASVPQDTTVWQSWCWALERQGNLKELITAIERIPPKIDRTAEVCRLQSIAAEQKGNVPAAIQFMKEAIERGSDPKFRMRLSQLLFRSGQTQEGKRNQEMAEKQKQVFVTLKESIDAFREQYNPSDRKSAVEAERIAHLLDQLERFDESVHWRQLALAVDPAFQPAIDGIKRHAARKPTSTP